MSQEDDLTFEDFEDFEIEHDIDLTFNGDMTLAKSYLEQDDYGFNNIFNETIFNSQGCEPDWYLENSINSSSTNFESKLSSSSTENKVLPSISENTVSSANLESESNDGSLITKSTAVSSSINSEIRSSSSEPEIKISSSFIVPKGIAASKVRIPSYKSHPGELRLPYLLRFPKLLQVALNGADSKMLQSLCDEVLTEDVLHLTGVYAPMIGRKKFVELFTSFAKAVPDSLLICSNIKHTKRRIITFKAIFAGTLVFHNPNELIIQMFENASTDYMDGDDMKNNKLIFERCKSQKKSMTFERNSQMVCGLNFELTHIEKVMSKNMSTKFFEHIPK